MPTRMKHDRAHVARTAIVLSAAVVAAAGAYFLYGSKNAAQNRKKVKSWMLKAKAEVLEELEAADIATQEDYEALIDSVAARYERLRNATLHEVQDFKREMKAHWPEIESSAKDTLTIAGHAALRAAVHDVADKMVRRVDAATEPLPEKRKK